MKRDIYQEISELEAGAAPWVKPWNAGLAGTVHNAATGRAYSGINILLLWIESDKRGWQSTGFVTCKQAQQLGGNVKKGEHGTRIVFWKFNQKTVKDQVTGEETEKTIPLLRAYTVFNVDQCENLKLPARENAIRELPEHSRIEAAEHVVLESEAVVNHGGDKAYYSPSRDHIQVPHLNTFDSAESYYATLLHELTHWTGHKSRCDRNLRGRFGSESYAAEELVAELGAAFLCGELGIQGELRHAGYIGSWLRVLKQDKRAIFTASSLATKAATFIKELAGLADSKESAPEENAA